MAFGLCELHRVISQHSVERDVTDLCTLETTKLEILRPQDCKFGEWSAWEVHLSSCCSSSCRRCGGLAAGTARAIQPPLCWCPPSTASCLSTSEDAMTMFDLHTWTFTTIVSSALVRLASHAAGKRLALNIAFGLVGTCSCCSFQTSLPQKTFADAVWHQHRRPSRWAFSDESPQSAVSFAATSWTMSLTRCSPGIYDLHGLTCILAAMPWTSSSWNVSNRLQPERQSECSVRGLEDQFPSGRPAWESVLGDACVFVEDAQPFSDLHLKVFEGARQLITYAGILLGYRRINEAIEEPVIVEFVKRYWGVVLAHAVAPSDQADGQAYQAEIFQRLAQSDEELLTLAEEGCQNICSFCMSIIPGLPPMDTPTIKPIVQLLCLWVRYIISSTDEVEKPYVHAADGRLEVLHPLAESLWHNAVKSIKGEKGETIRKPPPREETKAFVTAAFPSVNLGATVLVEAASADTCDGKPAYRVQVQRILAPFSARWGGWASEETSVKAPGCGQLLDAVWQVGAFCKYKVLRHMVQHQVVVLCTRLGLHNCSLQDSQHIMEGNQKRLDMANPICVGICPGTYNTSSRCWLPIHESYAWVQDYPTQPFIGLVCRPSMVYTKAVYDQVVLWMLQWFWFETVDSSPMQLRVIHAHDHTRTCTDEWFCTIAGWPSKKQNVSATPRIP
ncbi:MAN2 [Symbiodinium microadriaticum]|nr:MAN2 [Symbiodinium microadriaticum]